MLNLSTFIQRHAARAPDAIAIVFQSARISYADFLDRIRQAAGWLSDHDVGSGDVVAVLMKNSAAFLDLAFASSHIGAVFLPINFRLSAEEVSFIIENSGAKLLLVDEDLQACAKAGCPIQIMTPELQADSRRLAASAPRAVPSPRDAEDIFRLMYTSGTTDRPKGVIHTYANYYWKNWAHVIELGLSAQTRLLIAGPLFHVGAFDLPGTAVLMCGGTLVILRDFDPAAALAAIEAEQITGAWLAPVMTNQILNLPARLTYDVGSLQWVIGGGERTPEQRILAFRDYFTGARYIDAYGLTESGSGDTFMVAGSEVAKIGSVGKPVSFVQVSIRDNDGRSLGPGRDGEICLRGPKITQGYWRDQVRTQECFFEGWLRTGDIGHFDEDGFLFLTDRKKDMIISGGENIAASEVERVLHALPEVLEAAVVGVSDERWGERPVAFLVTVDGARIDADAVSAHCRRHLAGFKVPRQIVIRDKLPRNASGKVLKAVLRADAGDLDSKDG